MRADSKPPLLAPLLCGSVSAVLLAGVVFAVGFVLTRDRTPAPPVVENPPPPGNVPPPAQGKGEAWWQNIPDSRLAATVAQLKRDVPEEASVLDSIGDRSETARLVAYHKLLTRMPDVLRDPKVKPALATLLGDCYALDPDEENVRPLRDWLVEQIPKENTPFTRGAKPEEIERSFWALDVAIEALTQKGIRTDRVRYLSEDLGAALGLAIDASTPRAELKARAEKLLALRCYRNLAPTAALSAADAFTMRTAIATKTRLLAPSYRAKIDIEIASIAFGSAKAEWDGYGGLLRDCVNHGEQAIHLKVIDLYAVADPALAGKMETVLAPRFKSAADAALDQTEKVKAIRRTLGVADPADRLTQLEKLAREAMTRTKAPEHAGHALLQETVRMAHASTLACALAQRDKGVARFDDMVAKVPEIEPVDTKPAEPKVVLNPKKGNPKQPGVVAGVALVTGPLVFRSRLTAASDMDADRQGCYRNTHVVTLQAGRTYAFHLLSNFDNYLRIESLDNISLAEDDDSGGGLNARIVFTPEITSTYRIVATSCRPGSIGPYVLNVQPLRNAFGFGAFPPALMQPKQPDPRQAIPGDPNSQVEDIDLNNLEVNHGKTRATAMGNIASNLKADLLQTDLTTRQAKLITKYLLAVQDKGELELAVAKLAPLGRSRILLLTLADSMDAAKTTQRNSESVLAALLEQPVHFGKDNWRTGCRKLLLQQVVELADTRKNGALETAEILCAYYKMQAALLGMDPAGLRPMTKPTQVMESAIQHLGAALAKKPRKEDQDALAQATRQALVAQFVAENDLEHTVLLQRVWINVLSVHLQRQYPDRAKLVRQAEQETRDKDLPRENILEQLRGGEERILRLWSAALDLK